MWAIPTRSWPPAAARGAISLTPIGTHRADGLAMSKNKRDALSGKVVVITGGSSGIGRATAVQFAAHGCRVVVAARRDEDLEETARLCRAAGGEAFVVVTDVTVEEDMHRLASETEARLGRIDVWVNNAGVTLFARLTDAPFEEHRRVIETNLFGSIFGARAVLPVFRRHGGGVLINVSSVAGEIGQPFVPSYAISKAAVRGLSEALRVETADEPTISVCTIYPFATDTPHFQSGANHVGAMARAMPPLQSPERVAAAIVQLAVKPQREVHVPKSAVLGLAAHALFPRLTERLLLRALERFHFDDTAQADTTGNLYRPVEWGEGRVHGARRPRITTAAFAAWTLGELLTMAKESIRHIASGSAATEARLR